MKKSSKILLTLAAGAAAGGALGVLFSPEKGCETRRKLSKEAKKFVKSLNGDLDKSKLQQIKGKLEKYRSRLDKHIEKLNARLQEPQKTTVS